MSIFLDFDTDKDTMRLFQIVVWCLKRYFRHTDESAIEAVNKFYKNNIGRNDDDFYHHEMPFRIALRVQYTEVLHKGDDKNIDFYNWRSVSGYDKDPKEAINYFREFFFVNE